MTRKPTRRIEFTVPEELGERYDEARGLIPMATWIKAIVDERLNGGIDFPARYNEIAALSSADAKRAVRPIPKAGKR